MLIDYLKLILMLIKDDQQSQPWFGLANFKSRLLQVNLDVF